MALKRMDNVGIVVDDLTATIDFFLELGLELEGRAMVEGEWAGRVTGLGDQRVEIAMMRTPDGHGRLELSRFLTPPVVADHRNAPVNALGYLRAMFAVDDLDETLERLRTRGAQLVGSARAARSSWAKWFNIRTRIGSATSAGRKGFSSDSPKSSAECRSLGTTTPCPRCSLPTHHACRPWHSRTAHFVSRSIVVRAPHRVAVTFSAAC
jgi:catechol 2,3-dioxygenase-like lactoylglutathione lyase family enzyme